MIDLDGNGIDEIVAREIHIGAPFFGEKRTVYEVAAVTLPKVLFWDGADLDGLDVEGVQGQ